MIVVTKIGHGIEGSSDVGRKGTKFVTTICREETMRRCDRALRRQREPREGLIRTKRATTIVRVTWRMRTTIAMVGPGLRGVRERLGEAGAVSTICLREVGE